MTKRGEMAPGGFERYMLPKFSPTFECVKDLARTLRGILFKEALYTGTPDGPRARLYDSMIKAFDVAIETVAW